MHLVVQFTTLHFFKLFVVYIMFFHYIICNKLDLLTSQGSAAFYIAFVANFIRFPEVKELKGQSKNK